MELKSLFLKKLLLTYDEHSVVRKLARLLGYGYAQPHTLTESRTIEYPWIYKNIGNSKGKLLDVGCTGSLFPLILSFFGFEVHLLDFRPYEWKCPENVEIIVGDIRKTKFLDNFFDVITAVSTIEHIGLGRYTDPKDIYGDRLAVKEIWRILKKNGIFLMTVPFGKKDGTIFHRVYDLKSINELLNGFSVEKIEFFGLKNGFWYRDEAKNLETVNSTNRTQAIALVKAKKTERALL